MEDGVIHPQGEALGHTEDKNRLAKLPLVGRFFDGERHRPRRRAGRAIGALAVVAVVVAGAHEYRSIKADTANDLNAMQDALAEQQTVIDDQDAQITSLEEQLQEVEDQRRELDETTDRLAGIIANESGRDAEAVSGENLINISDLPAFGESVSAERQELLSAATVKIGRRSKGGDGIWFEFCSGVKVTGPDGNVYVSGSAHCFNEAVEDQGHIVGIPAMDVAEDSIWEYAILDPALPVEERERHPLAQIEAVAVDTSGTSDRALLRPHANNTPNTQGRTFDAVAAMSLYELTSNTRQPVPGQTVAISGISGNSGNQQIDVEGVYVGRVATTSEDAVSDQVDVVAVPQTGSEFLVCDPGSSGSSAASETFHFPSLQMVNAPDDFHDFEEAQAYHLWLQEQLGVDLQDVGVCGYTVSSDLTTHQLIRIMGEKSAETLPASG